MISQHHRKINLAVGYVNRIRSRLINTKAPKTIIDDFDEKILINEKLIEELQCPAEDLLEEACRKFNFTAPFESDGKPRTFRASLLDHQHKDYRADIGGNFVFASKNTPSEEQSYRRGFDQGFAEARRMIEEKRSLSEVRKHEEEIRLWRTAKIQIIGTLPGGEEPINLGISLSGRSISLRLRYKVLKRDGSRCKICGASLENGNTLEVDHIIPVAKGGTNDESNLQILCWDCNRGKADS